MVKYNARTKKATFEAEFGDVGSVAVLGQFNNWDASANPLKKTRAGTWKGEAMVGPGRYEFIYRIDERDWRVDDVCETVVNSFGSKNSVFIVPSAKNTKSVVKKKKKN